MGPKHKSSDAGNSNMAKRSCKVLPLNEKVKVHTLIKEKKLYAEFAKIDSKNQSSIHEIVKEKEICASFVVVPQTAKVTATLHDKSFVRMEKALNLYKKIF